MRFKTRLILTFGLFAFILCILFASLLSESLTAVEDHVASSLLQQESDYLLSRHQQDPELMVMPDLDQLKGYLSANTNTPEWLKPLQPGFHQFGEFHVLVQSLENDQRMYLVYDETHGVLEQNETILSIMMGILILIVSLIGLGLGYYQASVLSRPIDQLTAQIAAVNTDNPQIVALHGKDEIGVLSRAYADLIGRLGQFIQREKAFTRYASHELMTPLSVINNNLELLKNENIGPDMQGRATDRLREAAKHMQHQIEVFLMLAREDRLEPTSQALDWNKVLADVTAQFPQLSLSQKISAEPEVYIREVVAQTILANILSNVVKHGEMEQGPANAMLTLDEHSLEVSNAIAQTEDKAISKFGFGLEINEKLCTAVGWQFSVSEENEQFVVTVNF